MKGKIKKDRIVKAIKTHADVGGSYCDGHGHYCVLGTLLSFAGVSDRVLMKLEGSPGSETFPRHHLSTLLDEFGLDTQAAGRLMDVNDDYSETSNRRRALLKALDDIVANAGDEL
jgi:hypothetical protein